MTDITELAQSLKAAAEKSGVEKWQVKRSGPGEYEVIVKGSLVKRSGWSTHRPVTEGVVDKKTADFIALANPANVIALVETLEKAQQRNGELETYSKTAIEFREAARDENRHLKLELEIAEKRIAELESRTVPPVTYPESADADHCRKWAWEQVKGEVSTEGWTIGDNITYFGFFSWGWDMRRQYNEQRTVTVKLPQAVSAGGQGYQEQVERILTAAGIKWEAE